MSRRTTLAVAIAALDELETEAVLYARQPWAAESEAVIELLTEDLETPSWIVEAGLSYFLEVHVAREVLEVFGANPPTPEERLRLLLYYAKNDAFPEWVYER